MRQKQIKDNLRKFRKEKMGYTQQQVADYLKISRSTYTYYETGKTEPDLESIQKLAKLFDVTVGELLGSEPSPKAVRSPSSSRSAWLLSSEFTPEERKLIQAFRSTSPETRRQIRELLASSGKPEKKEENNS